METSILICLIAVLSLPRGDCNNQTRYRGGADRIQPVAKAVAAPIPVPAIQEGKGFPRNYDINVPPRPSDGKPVAVDISVVVFDIRDIIEMNGELTLEVNFKMSWKDVRLRQMANNWNYAVVRPSLLKDIWHPDIYIDHVKKIDQPNLMSMPAYLRIYNDSTVRYSARTTIGMSCQMDFHYYPADTQHCDIDMKSYAYSDESLKLGWAAGKGAAIKKDLVLQNYVVALGGTNHFAIMTKSEHYTGLRFTVVLKRKLNFHIIQTYVPSTLFVVISWLSFFVSPELVPGRMTVCMTTLLTLIAMFGAIRQNSPVVSYVKGLDIWMVVCVFFVFLTLVEYTTVLKLRSLKLPDAEHPDRHNYLKISQRLEKIASKLIPLLFLVFIFIYWPWLLIASNYYKDGVVTRYED